MVLINHQFSRELISKLIVVKELGIGSTGSGKSTSVELLMGLLKPTTGRVIVDGLDIQIRNILRASSLALYYTHVPQNIYLADSSIAENIAFGIPADAIDMARVCVAAEQAQMLLSSRVVMMATLLM